MSGNSILELRFVACDASRWIDNSKFFNQRIRQFIIGVQRKHPRGSNLRETEIPLRRVSIECALYNTDIWMRGSRKLDRSIGASTINDNNFFGPRQFPNCSRDVL